MKKILLTIIFSVVALINAQAVYHNEEHNWYAQVNGSLGWHNDSRFSYGKNKTESIHFKQEQKLGFGGSIAIGYILDQWRLELEASHRENPSKSKYYRSNTSLMANVYYDIPLMEDLSLYIGAGAGISSINGKVTVDKKGKLIEKQNAHRHLDTVFAWQVMTGFSYALSEDWDLIAGYRLFGTTSPTLANFDGKKVKMTNIPVSHSVELGLRFKF